jgi:uncharacterized membrane protein YfcA
VGAGVQRVSGIGFALISAPLLVLLLGPYDGIVVANLLAVIVAATTLASTWRDVDRSRAWVLVPTGLVGVIPGVIVSRTLPTDLLQVVIGALIVVGMVLVLFRSQASASATTRTNVGTGLISGFMTATAGVGGPALTVYAVATEWPQRAFAATAQLCFIGQSTLSIALKGLPDLSLPKIAVLVLVVAAGLACGHLLAGRVPEVIARRFVIGLALLGATAAIAKGIVGMVSS